MNWSAVMVGTGVFHAKRGSGEISQINHAERTCTIKFILTGEQSLTFEDMITGKYGVLIWTICK